MRLLIITEIYPATYKPYYDTHFADLVDAGHEVRILAYKTGRDVWNDKVIRYGLHRLTTTYPIRLAHVPRFMVSARARGLFTRRPLAAWAATTGPAKSRLLAALRAAALGPRPDAVVIHALTPATHYHWLKAVWPDVPVGLYYHGGEVPTVPALRSDGVAQAFQAADHVFSNTRSSTDHARERGCPRERLHILPVGFDLRDFEPPAPRTYRPEGVLRLLSAGRMSEEKGLIHALEALVILRDHGIRNIHYSMTGQGYYRQRLEEYVAAHDLGDQVSFLGVLSMDGVVEAMGATDALLLPSIKVGNWMENQATSVQQAMLMKAVVVATDLGGVPESIPSVMEPFKVPPEDPEALADAVRRIHELEDHELQGLGTDAREWVMEHYDIRELDRRMLAILTGDQPLERAT